MDQDFKGLIKSIFSCKIGKWDKEIGKVLKTSLMNIPKDLELKATIIYFFLKYFNLES